MIKLKNNLQEIDRMTKELEIYCDKEDLPSKIKHNLTLVLEELVTNIISYGYKDEKEHIISISFKKDKDTLIVEVEDDGIAFDPLKAKPPAMDRDIDEMEPGGLGIHLVKKLTDEIEYRRKNNRNFLTFKMKLTQSQKG